MPQRLRSPIWWFGGKGMMVSKLLPYLPPHHTWVEVFGGGASLTFAKAPSPVEVYNDIDEGLVNFFRVLRDRKLFRRLHRLCQLTPYSRAWYYHCRKNWKRQMVDVNRAYMWYIVVKMSFSGVFSRALSTAVGATSRGMARPVSGWLKKVGDIRTIHERFSNVDVERLDFRNVFARYDSASTLFYCDPPYVHGTRREKVYEHEMSDDDHRELVDIILNVKGMVLLSGYHNEIYKPLEEAGWGVRGFGTVCFAAARTRHTKILGTGSATMMQPRTEVLWMNPQCMRRLWPLLY